MEFSFKELINDKLVRDVQFCGYPALDSVVKACTTKLPKDLTGAEQRVLERFVQKHHGQLTLRWSLALVYGEQARYMSTSERTAVVKLARRQLIKVFEVSGPPCELSYLWEAVMPGPQVSPDATGDSATSRE